MKRQLSLSLLALALFSSDIRVSWPCTRSLFVGQDNTVITGRSMDWEEEMSPDLWLMPRGVERNGLSGPNPISWVSKYGSVVTSVYNLATADGINEMGLVANLLYLAESDYGQAQKSSPSISVSLWAQYVLDNFSSVAEATAALEARPFYIVAPSLPNGRASAVHLSLSDTTGDSAIFEYIDGKLVVHHGKSFNIMTNSPIYSKQIALNEYWSSIGGTVFLPGTSRAADRFARASFYTDAVPKTIAKPYIKSVPEQGFSNQAVAEVLSIMRAVSVPLGLTTPNTPNIASTIFRTISDQKRQLYFFDSATSPNTFWVDLKQFDFSKEKEVKRLGLNPNKFLAGEVSSQFTVAPAFKFLGASNQ